MKTIGLCPLEPDVQPMLYWFSSVNEHKNTPNWQMLVLYPAFCGRQQCGQLIHISTHLSFPSGKTSMLSEFNHTNVHVSNLHHHGHQSSSRYQTHKTYALQFSVQRAPLPLELQKAICGFTPDCLTL